MPLLWTYIDADFPTMNVDNFPGFPMGFPNFFLCLTHGKLVGAKKLTRFWRPWNLWDKVKATGHSWPQLSISVLKEKESLALREEILEPQNDRFSGLSHTKYPKCSN